MNERGRPVHQG